jgi:hypothetical protein
MPSGETPTPAKIFCLWSVEGDTSTMFSIWNYAGTPQDATLILFFSGGQYRIPIHLDARQTFNLDLMTLVRSRIPDANGVLIPENISSGSAMLIGPKGDFDNMTIVASASTYNVRNATCYPICLSCNGIASISVPNYSVIKGGTVQAAATITRTSGSTQATSGTWTSSATNTATVNGNGIITGVNAGSANITFGPVSAPDTEFHCYQMGETVCPDLAWSGTGQVTVQLPTYFFSPSASPFGGLPPVCTQNGSSHGYFINVSYYVADQNSSRISKTGMAPGENVGYGWNDSYATPPTTNSDGSFVDTPVGSCSSQPTYCFSSGNSSTQSFRLTNNSVIFSISTNTTSTRCDSGIQLVIHGNPSAQNKTYTFGTLQ